MRELLCVDGPYAGRYVPVRDGFQHVLVPFVVEDGSCPCYWAPEEVFTYKSIPHLEYATITRTYNGRRIDVLALTEDSKRTMRNLFAEKLGVGVDFFQNASQTSQRGTGRTTRMLEEALTYAGTRSNVVIVGRSYPHAVELRNQFSRLAKQHDYRVLHDECSVLSIGNTRFTFVPVATLAGTCRGRSNVHVFWDHWARGIE